MNEETKKTLKETVTKMLAPGKGILAADESNGTADKRLEAVGAEIGENNRRAYRELLFTTNEFEKYVSGVILFDETIRQAGSEGQLFRDLLKNKGVQVGIKVDTGAKDSLDFPREKMTEGLDGLPIRLAEYKQMGSSFAKWRAVVTIDENLPTDGAIEVNAEALATYALECQKLGIVPMIEPEVLFEGSHTMVKAGEVTERALEIVFEKLEEREVWIPGIVLKTSMVIPGSKSGENMDYEKVAEATVTVLKKVVPAQVGGAVFLSGGQAPDVATHNFAAIARKEPLPWQIAFSFSRALQQPVLEAWRGKSENVAKAQEIFSQLLKNNSRADRGLD